MNKRNSEHLFEKYPIAEGSRCVFVFALKFGNVYSSYVHLSVRSSTWMHFDNKYDGTRGSLLIALYRSSKWNCATLAYITELYNWGCRGCAVRGPRILRVGGGNACPWSLGEFTETPLGYLSTSEIYYFFIYFIIIIITLLVQIIEWKKKLKKNNYWGELFIA